MSKGERLVSKLSPFIYMKKRKDHIACLNSCRNIDRIFIKVHYHDKRHHHIQKPNNPYTLP